MITTTDILYEGVRHVVLHATGEAETTEDEASVIKLDLSNLLTTPIPYKDQPTNLSLVNACWNTTFNFVRVEWDKDGGNETALLCNGDGERDFSSVGAKHNSGNAGSNDILFTTNGGADGDAYDIVLTFKLEF